MCKAGESVANTPQGEMPSDNEGGSGSDSDEHPLDMSDVEPEEAGDDEEEQGQGLQVAVQRRGRRDAPGTIDLARMKTKEAINDVDTTFQDVLLFNQHEGARQQAHLAGMLQRLMAVLERGQRGDSAGSLRFDEGALGSATISQCKMYLNNTILAGGMQAAYAVSQSNRRQHVVKPVCSQNDVGIDSTQENHVRAKKVQHTRIPRHVIPRFVQDFLLPILVPVQRIDKAAAEFFNSKRHELRNIILEIVSTLPTMQREILRGRLGLEGPIEVTTLHTPRPNNDVLLQFSLPRRSRTIGSRYVAWQSISAQLSKLKTTRPCGRSRRTARPSMRSRTCMWVT